MQNAIVRGALSIAFTFFGFWSVASNAGIVQIDQFEVIKNGSSIFADTFSNNLTPSQESNYAVLGTFPGGAEAAGRLTLNSDWGELTLNAQGDERRNLRTSLLTNTNPANPANGLTRDSTLAVTGTFDLAIPSGPFINGYGVRFFDAVIGQTNPDRVVQLDVQYNSNFGGNVIRYLLQDFVNDTITTLGFVALATPVGADQISLMISRPDIANDNFFGSYAFGTGGVFGSFVDFSTPGALFTNTDFVRAQFQSFEEIPAPIPEPGTIALFGLGLAVLAASRRRKH